MKVKHSIHIKEFNFQLLSFNQRDSGVESLPFIKHMVRDDTEVQPVLSISCRQLRKMYLNNDKKVELK